MSDNGAPTVPGKGSVGDQTLMQAIKTRWGAAIDQACETSSVKPEFLAALIANEDGKHGGDPAASRFEPAVFERLKEVLLGTRASYAPAGVKRAIAAADLRTYCDPGVGEERGSFTDSLQCLHNLATSWGLTQIMGWHLVEFQSGFGTGYLATSGGNLNFATRLLGWFAERYQLDLAADFADLFHCWNTGVPGGDPSHPTFDPNYVANGLARLAIYQSLQSAAVAGQQ